MFESDDFDQVLSQLDYIEASPDVNTTVKQTYEPNSHCSNINQTNAGSVNEKPSTENKVTVLKPLTANLHPINIPQRSKSQFEDYDKIETYNEDTLPEQCNKQSKKRLLGSLFDHQSKRKFPGPAGLLHLKSHCDDENLSHLEISSQDVDFTQERLHPSVFDLNLWTKLQKDVLSRGVDRLESIDCIKEKEFSGRLSSRKAHAVVAFVEAVDRSVDDHLIILRDKSGTIKCTLHRDAWSEFAPCIMSEYAAIALWKPTVFTAGTTHKKHYLNITLSNIIAVYYSSNGMKEEKPVPDGYSKVLSEDFVAVMKNNCDFSKSDIHKNSNQNEDIVSSESSNLLDGLDCVSFLDEEF